MSKRLRAMHDLLDAVAQDVDKAPAGRVEMHFGPDCISVEVAYRHSRKAAREDGPEQVAPTGNPSACLT